MTVSIVDRSGQVVGWLEDETILDRDERPRGYVLDGAVFDYQGRHRGAFREDVFTDLDGRAVAYLATSPQPITSPLDWETWFRGEEGLRDADEEPRGF